MICFLFISFVTLKYANSKFTSRLLGGRDADLSEFPYVVRMEVQTLDQTVSTKTLKLVFNAHVCTGAAIASTWTLTAAHCVTSLQRVIPDGKTNLGVKAVIRYGSVINTPERNTSFSDVLSYIKHPSYKMNHYKQRQIVQSDIGLLRTQPIKLLQYGKICAVDYATLIGHKSVIVGFGLTHSIRLHGVSSTLTLNKPLQVTNIVIKKCEKEDLFTIYPVVCVASACGRSVTLCPGDSGGPLMHPSGIIAVNSLATIPDCFVADKHRSNMVGLLTPVSTYIDWIVDHIK